MLTAILLIMSFIFNHSKYISILSRNHYRLVHSRSILSNSRVGSVSTGGDTAKSSFHSRELSNWLENFCTNFFYRGGAIKDAIKTIDHSKSSMNDMISSRTVSSLSKKFMYDILNGKRIQMLNIESNSNIIDVQHSGYFDSVQLPLCKWKLCSFIHLTQFLFDS